MTKRDDKRAIVQPADSYQTEQCIAAIPETVFDAVATRYGLSSWWTQDVTGSLEVGAMFELGFTDVDHMRMRVDRLARPAVVEYTCVERRLGEWSGTRLLFTIEPVGSSESKLTFIHEGLAPTLKCYEVCVAGWNLFMPSLKSFCESGIGRPWPKVAAKKRNER